MYLLIYGVIIKEPDEYVCVDILYTHQELFDYSI